MFKIKVDSCSKDHLGNRCQYLIFWEYILFREKHAILLSMKYNIYCLKQAVIKTLGQGLASTLSILTIFHCYTGFLTVFLSSAPVWIWHHSLSTVAPVLTVPPHCSPTPARLISPPLILTQMSSAKWLPQIPVPTSAFPSSRTLVYHLGIIHSFS